MFNEATAIAFDEKTNTVIAYGNAAYEMIGRNPPSIRVVRPLSTGVISDFASTKVFLKTILNEYVKTSRLRPIKLVIGVPSRISGAEFKTLQDAIDISNIAKIHAVQEPVAAAIGSGLNFSQPRGCLIIDIGAGTTDIAMLSLGRVVESRSLRIGADALIEAFSNYVKNELRINVGDRTAEEFLRKFGMAAPVEELIGELAGFDMRAGLPVRIEVTSEMIMNALREPVSLIITELRRLLDSVPPDLASDALTDGLNLTGGGTFLKGLDVLMKEQTGIECRHVEEPLLAVVKGCGVILEDLDSYKFVLESITDDSVN